MNFTPRMVALLAKLRRERNGVVADAMGYYGRAYGLNYGVSLPTLRELARAESPDHDFARYLYQQDVRELQLTALHIAQPERVERAEFAVWAAGIRNSEMAEEAAFALLSRMPCFSQLFNEWVVAPDPLLQYAALLAAARWPQPASAWIAPAIASVRRNAVENSEFPFAGHLIAQGAVAMLAALGAQNKENRQAVCCAVDSLGTTPSEDFVHEELAWRLEA